MQLPEATAAGIEHEAGNRIGLEALQGGPIYPAVAGNERRAVTVADQGVVTDRPVAALLRGGASAIVAESYVQAHATIDEECRAGDVVGLVGADRQRLIGRGQELCYPRYGGVGVTNVVDAVRPSGASQRQCQGGPDD